MAIQNYENLQTRKELTDIDIKLDHQKNNWKMLWEWHEQVETMYVLSGTGKCYIEDKVYTFSERDLFVIGPHKLHKTELLPQQDFKVYIVLFNIELQKYFPINDNMDVLQFIKLNFADYPARLFLEKE